MLRHISLQSLVYGSSSFQYDILGVFQPIIHWIYGSKSLVQLEREYEYSSFGSIVFSFACKQFGNESGFEIDICETSLKQTETKKVHDELKQNSRFFSFSILFPFRDNSARSSKLMSHASEREKDQRGNSSWIVKQNEMTFRLFLRTRRDIGKGPYITSFFSPPFFVGV